MHPIADHYGPAAPTRPEDLSDEELAWRVVNHRDPLDVLQHDITFLRQDVRRIETRLKSLTSTLWFVVFLAAILLVVTIR